MIGAEFGRLHSGGAALFALPRVGQRLLRGAFGDADALQPDGEPRAVHHGEHARHAGIFFADQVADRTVAIAQHHGAGRRTMDAELVLDRVGADVVAGAERAVGVEQKFRHQEQRNAARTGRRVGQPGEHEMDDVVGEIMLAVSDENLLSLEAIAAVGRALGARAQRTDIGAGLRLGELHAARPFAGHELFQIGLFERFGAVGVKRIDRGDGQQWADGESHRRGVPHFLARHAECLRQRLAAPFGRRGKPVPAAAAPAAIRFLPAGRRGHGAVLERGAERVADAVEWRDHLGGEAAGLGQHCVDVLHGEIAKQAFVDRGGKSGGVFESGADVGKRSAICHRRSP